MDYRISIHANQSFSHQNKCRNFVGTYLKLGSFLFLNRGVYLENFFAGIEMCTLTWSNLGVLVNFLEFV